MKEYGRCLVSFCYRKFNVGDGGDTAWHSSCNGNCQSFHGESRARTLGGTMLDSPISEGRYLSMFWARCIESPKLFDSDLRGDNMLIRHNNT